MKQNAIASQSTPDDKAHALKAVDGSVISLNNEVSCDKLQDNKSKPQPCWRVDFEYEVIQKMLFGTENKSRII